MKEPVEFRGPGAAVRFAELRLEVDQRFLLRLAVDHEGLAQVTDVVKRLQLRYAAGKHHCEKRDENVGVLV